MQFMENGEIPSIARSLHHSINPLTVASKSSKRPSVMFFLRESRIHSQHCVLLSIDFRFWVIELMFKNTA